MSQQCDREGVFRALITEYGLKEMESGSVAVCLRATIQQYLNDKEWEDWREFDMTVEGDVWVVKKDGTVNKQAAESLMKWAGWDGSLEAICNHTWVPVDCQITVKLEEYEGNKRFKIAFVNDWDRVPGMLNSNVTTDKAKELQTKFGAQLRAIAGNVRRNGAPTTARPAAPAPAPAAAVAPAPLNSADDIPF